MAVSPGASAQQTSLMGFDDFWHNIYVIFQPGHNPIIHKYLKFDMWYADDKYLKCFIWEIGS